jgi:hypothetical protein
MVVRTVVVETEMPEDIYQTRQAHGLYAMHWPNNPGACWLSGSTKIVFSL